MQLRDLAGDLARGMPVVAQSRPTYLAAPAILLRILHVHRQQVGREQGGLITARPRPDLSRRACIIKAGRLSELSTFQDHEVKAPLLVTAQPLLPGR